MLQALNLEVDEFQLYLVPDFFSVAVFRAPSSSHIDFTVWSKLKEPLMLRTLEQQPIQVPANARLLRAPVLAAVDGGGPGQQVQQDRDVWLYNVAFGLPWSYETFIAKACAVGHPWLLEHSVPDELKESIRKNAEWTDAQMADYRRSWSKRWLARALQLAKSEKRDSQQRPDHVRKTTDSKRLLLTAEMLDSIGYQDMASLDILRHGGTLAGPIESTPVFKQQFKPAMLTIEQLERESGKRNQAILATTKSSGDAAVDRQLLEETREELSKGWAVGPFGSAS